MRILLDTHLVVWWLLDIKKLPGSVIREVNDADGPVFVSQASLWEMAIMISTGKLNIDLPRLVEQARETGFKWLQIKNTHLLSVASLEQFADHRDPFDRLLVAQSRTEPLVLLTHDKALARYGDNVRVV